MDNGYDARTLGHRVTISSRLTDVLRNFGVEKNVQLNNVRSAETVSYTHLDVYKRQEERYSMLSLINAGRHKTEEKSRKSTGLLAQKLDGLVRI